MGLCGSSLTGLYFQEKESKESWDEVGMEKEKGGLRSDTMRRLGENY